MQMTKISVKRTLIALLIPIASLLIGDFLGQYLPSQAGKLILVDVISLLAFGVSLALYGNVLQNDWQQFKTHFWRNLLFALGGMLVSYLLLSVTRNALALAGLSAEISLWTPRSPLMVSQLTNATYGLIGTIPILLAPFTEEIVFRHALFFQFKGRKWLTGFMFVLSAIAFGLAHWNNFSGHIIAMIPYMVVGAWFALLYWWSKNIWQNIATHFLFDFVQVLAAIFVFIMALISG